MNADVSPQSPQLARARSILAAAVIAGADAPPGDVGVLDFDDALAILAGVIPPLPLPAPVAADQPVTREAAIAALREATAVAADPSEALRLAEAGRALTAPALT